MLSSSQRLGTPSRSPGPKKAGSASGRRSGVVWTVVVFLAAIALLTVWRLRDVHAPDRRSLLSVGQSFSSLPGSGTRSARGGDREFKLSREVNVTKEELLNKEKRVLELEAENAKVRRDFDVLLGELDKLKLNKTAGDSNALVESEGLRGELATALDRAGLAEHRMQLAAGLMAACQTRIQETVARMPVFAAAAGQANGSVHAAFAALSAELSNHTSKFRQEADVLAAGVNGTVHSGMLDQHGGVGAAEVILQASDAEQAVQQEAGSSGASSMDPAQLSAAMHHSAASAHGAEAAAQGAAASQTAAAEQALETGPGLEKV